ncbi:hypothetical protein RB653_005464 [Dictyostelium firmibasis]|uniref:Uncharacterized protein n=1 Tax=Dictyostelium firmibasis TaxID=79012 RepID=A0AAN7YY68_9MYCE
MDKKNQKYDLHTIVLNSKRLRKEHIKEINVIPIKGDVKEHFYELKIVVEAHEMAFKKCTVEEGLKLKEIFNGYGNIFTTTPHINEDKSVLSQLFIDNCIEKGACAVPILESGDGASSNFIINVNGDCHEITRKRLKGLSSYIKGVLSTNSLLQLDHDRFGRILQKYRLFLERVSELDD